MRSVLLISPYFPPSNLAGVHRARHLAKWLPRHDWHPIVLCVDERFHEERLDQNLADLVPNDAQIIKISALPAQFTRYFGMGDISLRSFLQLRWAVNATIRRFKPAVVLITGAPFFPMLLAGSIRRRFGLPVVLDFQDPWVSKWGASQPQLSKAGIMHKLGLRLEPRTVKGASFITSVSNPQNQEMLGRYPWLNPSSMAAIPIGGDPEDFNFAVLGTADRWLANGNITLSFVGSHWPSISGPLTAFFKGLRLFSRTEPASAKELRVRFIGTDATSRSKAEPKVLHIAAEHEVEKLVEEYPSRLPFLESLGVLTQSDALLMIGSDEPHYTASKIYPCLMSGRPFLSLFHRASSAHDILARAGGGIALSFETPAELERLVPVICEGLRQIVCDLHSLGEINPASYAPYTAKAVAGQFADIFNRLVSDDSRLAEI